MKKYDVIIIGGGPSGIITGVTGRKQNPTKSFLLIKEEKRGLVPCGIPYIFHDLKDIAQNAMGPEPFVAAGGEVLIDTVTEIDIAGKTLKTAGGNSCEFEKLVFATGSTPTIPTFIKGYDLEGVEYIKKSYKHIDGLKKKTDEARNIVVIGGGFIGVEVAEQLAKYENKNVSLVEIEEFCLYRAFSREVAEKANGVIKNANVTLYTNNKIEEITGDNGKVNGVILASGERLKADIVISAVGYRPNTELAGQAGLKINSNGAIRCDNYMRTTKEEVFAVGDCSQTIGFVTGRTDNIMLASTATAEARILGYNLFGIRLLRNFVGTLAVFSTEIGGMVFASAGAIEQSAHYSHVEYVVGRFSDFDRHPGSMDGAEPLMVKLIVSPRSGVIIGGEMYGGKSVGELINVVGLAIQKEVTVYEMISYQIGTHPLLTSAPTKYVLIKAAEMAVAEIASQSHL